MLSSSPLHKVKEPPTWVINSISETNQPLTPYGDWCYLGTPNQLSLELPKKKRLTIILGTAFHPESYPNRIMGSHEFKWEKCKFPFRVQNQVSQSPTASVRPGGENWGKKKKNLRYNLWIKWLAVLLYHAGSLFCDIKDIYNLLPTPPKERLNWYTQLHSEFNSPISSFLKDTLSIAILESLD